ncbi:DUF1007 family protein [Kaustia mangrovi]|uniref:DUF1007 family protein n=1 Tax=Kaustia mangrovi TaxID=2593653 RepID=A0A7S8C2M2_9HYPH|nr:DUF1007 family protein [Kaustia mangrovi]QPC42234.1 DUF1007 family protein [Kaustia mangrovi]
MRGKVLAGGVLAAGVLIAAEPAHAHPHVWIETHSDVVFDEEGRIAAVNVEWQFDEMYSAVAIEGLDTDGNGRYDPEELQPLAAENISALKEYDYFTYLKANGEQVAYGDVTEFGQFYKDGYLSLYFTVPLAKPVDPRKADVEYAIYDPTFYIAIEPAPKEPVKMIGAAPASCRYEIRKSAAEADNFQYSEDFWTQQSNANEGMGAMFARPVDVVCKSKSAAR